MSTARPVHQAIIDAACAATAADHGWLLVATADGLQVLAASGGDDTGRHVGRTVPVSGARGYAVASGQPAALRPAADDASNAGAGGADGVPGSLLATPCGGDDIVGVIEVVRADGSGFSFEDVEMASLLAEIAGAAIADSDPELADVTPPEHLATELHALATADPPRYANVARMIDALLGQV